jgi:threonine dehydrogenase-like Zn-dependent dehydrogenase
MVMHEQQLFLVPDSLSDEQAAMLEPCAIAVHAALRYQPQPGDNVLVIGAGTLGLLTIQAVQIFSPDASITALARYPVQIEMATRMGATSILYYDDGMAAVARHTGGQHFKRRFGSGMLVGGFDVVFDTIGSAQTMQNAIRWTRGGGVIIEAGSHLAPSSLDLTPIWHEEISVLGATSHGTEQWPTNTAGSSWLGQAGGRVSTFALAATLIRERRLIPERLITHRFPLREVRYALEVARDKATHRSIKVLMDVGNLRNPSFSVYSQTADRLTS